MNSKKILFVYQYAFSKTGGIQTYNVNFIRALEKIKNNNNVYIELLSIYDNEKDIDTCLVKKSLQKKTYKAFFEILRRPNFFDVFILGHVNLAPLGLIIKFLSPKTKIIFCTHGIEIWTKLSFSKEWIMNRSLILTVSLFSKEILKEFNSKLKDIAVIPNCVNIETKFGATNPYSSGKFNLLTVTRLDNTEKLKGVDSVIEAISHLVTKIPELSYTIIGKGDDIERLKILSEELKVSQYINFLGFVKDLDAYYQYCDTFILASKKEGFGIVYLEAMKYKKPIIASNYGGPLDVIVDGKTGFLCEYGDSSQLSLKINSLYEDLNLRIKMGKNGYERLLKKFTFDIFVSKLEKKLVKE